MSDCYLLTVFYLKLAFIAVLFPFLLVAGVFQAVYKFVLTSRKSVDISGKLALVTGGGNGLGKEICLQLAKKRCKVIILDLSIEAAEDVAHACKEKYNVDAKAYKADVSNYDELKRVLGQVEDEFGLVDILINNAGVMPHAAVADIRKEDVDLGMNVNFKANVWAIILLLNKMIERKSGHIVSINSMAGSATIPRASIYCASKHAMNSFMEALRMEMYFLGHKYIKVTTIQPYFLTTNKDIVNFGNKYNVFKHYPLVSGDYAAKMVVEAIEGRESVRFIPRIFGPILWFSKVLPRSVYQRVIENTLDDKLLRAEE